MRIEDVERFWEWVKGKAYDHGWSIREVERRAGFKYGRISNAARIVREPTLEMCKGIAKAFEMSLVEVQQQAGLLPSISPATEGEDDLLFHFRQLNSNGKKEAIALVKALKEAKGAGYDC